MYQINLMTKINKKLFLWIADAIIVLLVLGKIIYVTIEHHKHNKKAQPILVETKHASIRPMPYLLHAPGTIEAKNTVAVASQITAIVKQIHFNRGENVTQGQLLFELDPTSFLANINQAKAILAKDQTTLLQNERDAKRLTELAKYEYVTKQQAEQAVTVANAQAALVASDLALLEQAEIQLGYTKIYTPITGKAGDITIRPGDLVIANSSIPLVTINQLDSVFANFNLTQNQLKTLLQHQKTNNNLPVTATIEDEIKTTKYGKLGDIIEFCVQAV